MIYYDPSFIHSWLACLLNDGTGPGSTDYSTLGNPGLSPVL